MNGLTQREAPTWLIAVAVVIVAGGVFYFGRQAILGREGDLGPSKKVYPGMYDLRAEAAKMLAARRQGSQQNDAGR